MSGSPQPIRIAVFVSGRGSNLGAILRAEESWAGLARVELVVSNREDAPALDLARAVGRDSLVLPARGAQADSALLKALEEQGIHLMVLAGYLRLIPTSVVERFRGRILNVHPSLLPAFGGEGMYGSRVHEAVLESGCTVSGATVHFVDEVYDSGRVLAQWPVPVLPGDTPETLAERIQAVEHVLLPAAVYHVAEALAESRAPDRFRPPGPVFTLGEDAPDYQIKGQVARAFGER
ncbi:MAG: phosphoribosylglycinamide formyltransferase [Gemmatimonadota bacterium]